MTESLDLTVTGRYLSGGITLKRLIAPRLTDRYMPLDRLLVAYAVAIAQPPGVPEADRLAVYRPHLNGWRTDDALIALLRRFYPNSPTSLDGLIRLSAKHSLHTSANMPRGSGVVLLLPEQLVRLVQKHQDNPNGGAALFYKTLVR